MKTICVLFGGASSEHEVSLRSAASVLRNLRGDRWSAVMVGITRDGRWLRFRGSPEAVESGAWESGAVSPCILSPDRAHGGLLEITQTGAVPVPVDAVFPVLHGRNGEDGTVQGLLGLAGIPYVGCDVLSSAVCMDKAVCHTLLVEAGVPKTRLVALTRGDLRDFEALETRLAQQLGYPLFVKPANAGSSVGVSKVHDAAGLRDALNLAFAHDRKVVAEKLLTGREVECAVMGLGEPVAAAVLGEVAPKGDFYDYSGKYLDDTVDLVVPARIGEAAAQTVRETAVRAYRALGCEGLSRVDFFVDGETVVLNEINTLPGFTSISMFPKLFEADGVSYPEILDRLIEYAFQRQGVPAAANP